jgi:hypothetical protein
MPVISVTRIIVVERKTGADTDFEDTAAHLARRSRRCPPSIDKDRPAQAVIDWRPARVRFFHYVTVGIAQYGPSRIVLPREGVTMVCDTQTTRRPEPLTASPVRPLTVLGVVTVMRLL